MTGYESKRAMAQDKLALPAQEPWPEEPFSIRNGDTTRRWSGKTENIGWLDKTYAKWNKDGAELLKAYAEIKRIRVTCIINDGINTPPAQEKNNAA